MSQTNMCILGHLPVELLLCVVHYLDLRSRLNFSQSYSQAYRLSLAPEFWRYIKIADALCPLTASGAPPRGKSLRKAAIASDALLTLFDHPSIRIRHSIPIPKIYPSSCYFVPPGTRWLFQYDSKPFSTNPTEICVHDMVTGNMVGKEEIPGPIIQVAGSQICRNEVLLLVRHSPEELKFYKAVFTAETKGKKISVKLSCTKTLNTQIKPCKLLIQEGWVIVSDYTQGFIARWQKDDLSLIHNFQSARDCELAGFCVAGPIFLVFEEKNSLKQISVFELPRRSSNVQAGELNLLERFSLPEDIKLLNPNFSTAYSTKVDNISSALTLRVKTPFVQIEHLRSDTLGYRSFNFDILVEKKGSILGVKYTPLFDREAMSIFSTNRQNPYITLGPSGQRALWIDKGLTARVQSDNHDRESGCVVTARAMISTANWQTPIWFDDTLGVSILPDASDHILVDWFIPPGLLGSDCNPSHH